MSSRSVWLEALESMPTELLEAAMDVLMAAHEIPPGETRTKAYFLDQAEGRPSTVVLRWLGAFLKWRALSHRQTLGEDRYEKNDTNFEKVATVIHDIIEKREQEAAKTANDSNIPQKLEEKEGEADPDVSGPVLAQPTSKPTASVPSQPELPQPSPFQPPRALQLHSDLLKDGAVLLEDLKRHVSLLLQCLHRVSGLDEILKDPPQTAVQKLRLLASGTDTGQLAETIALVSSRFGPSYDHKGHPWPGPIPCLMRFASLLLETAAMPAGENEDLQADMEKKYAVYMTRAEEYRLLNAIGWRLPSVVASIERSLRVLSVRDPPYPLSSLQSVVASCPSAIDLHREEQKATRSPKIYSQRSAFHIRLSEAIKHINQDQLLAVFRGLANVSITYSLLEPNAAGYLGGALLTEHRAYVYLNAARGSIERRNLPGDWRTTLARQIRRLFELTSEHIIPIDIQGETDCLVLNAPTILSNTIKFSALSLGLKVESCIVLLPENTNDSPESKQ